ncbi:uncharacterized protein LOC128219528 isoform X1 [Mya arenaria]|uniref:uncharacterized protein LOC128219528 isoform X1 n=1 Tax=Mya arenaria TaxID=6604 RepID=UPI0022E89606|nr:uncharacterized protein LOC128219528 isoform X1 [Mya arenaria]
MEEDKSDIQSEIELDISSKEYHAAITRSHYVDVATRTCCQNKACGIVFGFPSFRRPHHCTRCGDVFCRPCLQYFRRLNVMAQFDPFGVLAKVCMSCYEERSVCLLGVTRSVTDYFLEYRGKDREEQRQLTCDLVLQKEKCATIRRFWRDQLTVDIYKECQRLIDGFSKAVGTSDTMMALTELRKILSVPSWQKSTFWQLDSGVTECRGCGKRLGSKRKHNCRVCGLALCKHCSVKELLLYFPDDKPDRPRLAIIRLEGCPEVEPRYSLLLSCCMQCKQEIAGNQTDNPDWFLLPPGSLRPEIYQFEQLILFDDVFQRLEHQFRTTEVHDNLDVIDGSKNEQSEEKENDNQVAARQDCLESYRSTYFQLNEMYKSSKCILSHTRSKVIQNVLMAKRDSFIGMSRKACRKAEG